MGCTDPDAPNYDGDAEIDDGSCGWYDYISFKDIVNGLYDCNASSLGYCNSDPDCPIVKIK